MMANANDILSTLGDEGKLVALNAKVTPEMRDLVYNLKKRSGKQVTQIITMALESFFEGYEPVEVADEDSLADDDEL